MVFNKKMIKKANLWKRMETKAMELSMIDLEE